MTTTRRRPLFFTGVAVVLFLLVLAWLGFTALMARSHLEQVRTEVRRLQNAVSTGETGQLAPGLAVIRDDASAAHRWTSDPIWWLASHLPVLGHTFATSSGLARATDQLADGTLPPLVDAADQLDPSSVRRDDGTLALGRLTAASPDLQRANASLADAQTMVADLPATGLVQPVATARDEFATQLASLAGSLDSAARAAQIGPAMLGADGPRRYLVVFQNPAEARGTGGLAGSYTIMRADNGKLSRERTGANDDLQDSPTPVVDLGPEFNARWRATDVDRGWLNANATPHYPWAAEIWQKLWERQSGQQVDGVITVDPIALGYLLKVTGPITLSDGETLTGDTVSTWTLSTEYFKYGDDNERRTQLLTELAEKAFDRIKDGDGNSADLLAAMARGAGQGRILLWAARPQEEASVLGTPLAGTPLDRSQPLAALVLNNGGGGKMDYYVDRTLTYEVLSCDASTRRVRATIRMRNDAPASGLPDYIAARVDDPSASDGQTRTFVNYYTTAGAKLTGATVDGKGTTVTVGVERGHPVFALDVEIDPGKTRTMVLEYTEPRVKGALTVPVQPLARPMTVRLSDDC